ncbi:MAG: VIT and VWA domain-containing protein [Planctomycetes bacterium]|nr:VIT and VWA domain-containing protein [Planctomycetota bacterium]
MRRFLAAVVAAAALAAIAPFVHACFIHSPLPVELIEDHITIDITDNIAVKQYTCTFFNPNAQAVVGGTCYMEFEADAQIDKLSMQLGDHEVQAEMLDAEKAKKVFAEIAAKGGKTALLEFYGKGLIRAGVPNIPPQGKVVAVLRYTQVLRSEDGVYRMGFLNTNPKALLKPLKRVVVDVTMKSSKPVKSIYSPTHNVTVTRADDFNATVHYEQENYLPKTPMALYWHVAGGDVGVSAMTYRDEEERGYFMMMVSPTIDPSKVPVIPQQVVFCVDSSGSMIEEDRLVKLQAALKYCLNRLKPEDLFNIVDFGTEARAFKEELLPATPENVKKALAHVDKLKPRGRTAIEEAVTLSLGMFTDKTDAKNLIFLTDGLPNEGETDTDKLADILHKKNTHNARMFTFGVGNELNTRLLDMLATDNGGSAAYVMPKEDLTTRITDLYDRIANPVLTDISVKFMNMKVEELYPRRLPDLFKGQQIVLFGRYLVDGDSWTPDRDVLVTGHLGGKEVSFPYTLKFPAVSARNDFLPRVWAGRKVGYLMEEVKRNGQSKELVDEITRLAKQYGIVTPYTSFLIADDSVKGDMNEMRRKVAEGFRKEQGGAFGAPSAPAAEAAKDLRDGEKAFDAYGAAGRVTGESEEQVMLKMRIIASKSFYNVGGLWTDSVYDPEKNKDVVTLKIGGDDYMKLIDEKPGIAKYLSLGKVMVVYQGKTYRTEE